MFLPDGHDDSNQLAEPVVRHGDRCALENYRVVIECVLNRRRVLWNGQCTFSSDGGNGKVKKVVPILLTMFSPPRMMMSLTV